MCVVVRSAPAESTDFYAPISVPNQDDNCPFAANADQADAETRTGSVIAATRSRTATTAVARSWPRQRSLGSARCSCGELPCSGCVVGADEREAWRRDALPAD